MDDDVIAVSMLGLVVISLAWGNYVSKFEGWMIFGCGLILGGIIASISSYLNKEE